MSKQTPKQTPEERRAAKARKQLNELARSLPAREAMARDLYKRNLEAGRGYHKIGRAHV